MSSPGRCRAERVATSINGRSSGSARQVVALYAMARQQSSELEHRQDLLGKLAIAEERIGALLDAVDHEVNAGRGPAQA